MRKMKYVIGFLILFMVIGFATVSVSLSITGSARITGDIDDFKVYFSDVKVNEVKDWTIVKDETELNFSVDLESIGSFYKISYDVTNASKMFDAQLSISCTQGDEYISIINDFDSSNLLALTTRNGSLTIKKLKAYASETDTDYQITCSIIASPVERDNEAVGDVAQPAERKAIKLIAGDGTNIGDELDIGGERFYVVSNDGSEAVLLAKYNLEVGSKCIGSSTYSCTEIENPSGIQSSKALGYTATGYNTTGNYGVVQFSSSRYWATLDAGDNIVIPPEYEDTYVYDANTYFKIYIDNYESYLEGFGLPIIESRILKLDELVSLGCSSPTVSGGPGTCSGTVNSWIYSTSYWTGNYLGTSGYIKSVSSDGSYTSSFFSNIDRYGVRPVIVISSSEI